MSAVEPCQAELQTAFQCTQMEGPDVCSCFDSATFTNQLKQDISQAYMSTLAFVSPVDPAWCKASDESVCQIAAAKHSCCCLPEVAAYRKCVVETVLPAEAGITMKCQHSCQKTETKEADGGSRGIVGTIVGVIVLLAVAGALWFWRRRRAANNIVTDDNEHNESQEQQGTSIRTDSIPMGNSKLDPWTTLMARLFRTKREVNNDSRRSPNKSDTDSIHKYTDLEAGNSSSSPPEERGNDKQLPSLIKSGPGMYQRRIQPSKAAQQTEGSSSFSSDYSSRSDDENDDQSSDDGTEMLKMINKKAGAFNNIISSPPKPLDTEDKHVDCLRKPPTDVLVASSAHKPSNDVPLHKAEISAHPPKASPRKAEVTDPKIRASDKVGVQGSKSWLSENASSSDDTSWDSSVRHEVSKAEELKKKRDAIESWNKERKKGSTKSLQAYMSVDDDEYDKESTSRPSSSRSYRVEIESSSEKASSFTSRRPGDHQSTSRHQEILPRDHKIPKEAPAITIDEAELEEDRKLTAQRIYQLEEKNKILQYDLEKACKQEEEARKRREVMNLRERRNEEEIRKEKETTALRIAELEEQNRRLQRKLEQKTSSRILLEEEDKANRRRLRKERKERADHVRLSEYYRLTSKRGTCDYEKGSLSWDDRSIKKRLDSDEW